jgi:hypothetical protein
MIMEATSILMPFLEEKYKEKLSYYQADMILNSVISKAIELGEKQWQNLML